MGRNRKQPRLLRSDAELKAAMRHVQREFSTMMLAMMAYSGHVEILLRQGPHREAAPLTADREHEYQIAISSALVESFLVHVRNLIDFFIGPGAPRSDDIIAADFFKDAATWWEGLVTQELEGVRARVSKKLAHLTYHRLADTDGWNPRDIVKRLLPLRNRFNSLDPAYFMNLELAGGGGEPLKPVLGSR